MSDIVVTLPKRFRWDGAPALTGLAAWLMEGDAAGEEHSGQAYVWTTSGRPAITPGERVYVVHDGALIGYAPLLKVLQKSHHISLVRAGNASAVTIDEHIPGFRGWRYRWWDTRREQPITNWAEIVAAAHTGRPLPAIRT